MLKSALAAVSCLYRVKALEDISQRQQIVYFKDALVKSGTVKPMEKSKVMPVKAFTDLFKSWPDNQRLSIRDLRLKAITLMAIVLMLRPSDIAPKGVKNITSESVGVTKLVFSTDHIKCLPDGGMLISFFGTKNDSTRTGFEVHMPPSTDAEVDPCLTLREYITRTDNIRPKPDNPVFLTLKKPYRALDASTISDIMNESIKLAGLSDKGYTAKSFRPTGATVAIETKQNPAQVMKTGRWKTESVFFDHYVHAKNLDSYSDSVLGVADE
jgi:integrase